MAEETPNEAATTQDENAPHISLQHVYIKDCSFEAPEGPHYLTEEWKPQLDLNINTKSRELKPETYEVILTVHAEAKLGDKTAFLVEIEQAGTFVIRNFSTEDMKRLMTAYCPGMLFPYARESASSLVSRGGFPQFLLPPVNFESLVARAEAEKEQQGAEN